MEVSSHPAIAGRPPLPPFVKGRRRPDQSNPPISPRDECPLMAFIAMATDRDIAVAAVEVGCCGLGSRTEEEMARVRRGVAKGLGEQKGRWL